MLLRGITELVLAASPGTCVLGRQGRDGQPQGWPGRGGKAGTPPPPSSPRKGAVEATLGLETSAPFKAIRYHQGSSHSASHQLPTGQPIDVNAWKSFCRQPEPGASVAEMMPQFWVPLAQGSQPWRSRAASCILSRACSRAANLRGGWGTAGSRTCLSQPNLILLR